MTSLRNSNKTGSITTSSDVALNNIQDNDALLYDATTKKWMNGRVATGSGSAASASLEVIVMHDGTASGPARPTGYARVRWVNPVGTSYTRPTNMAVGDVWEHD